MQFQRGSDMNHSKETPCMLFVFSIHFPPFLLSSFSLHDGSLYENMYIDFSKYGEV